MKFINQIASSSSNAQLPVPSHDIPNVGTGRSDPAKIVSTQSQTTTPLVYPSDRPQYYMRFDIINYSRANLNSVGALKPASGPAYKDGNSIILPVATKLEALHSTWW